MQAQHMAGMEAAMDPAHLAAMQVGREGRGPQDIDLSLCLSLCLEGAP